MRSLFLKTLVTTGLAGLFLFGTLPVAHYAYAGEESDCGFTNRLADLAAIQAETSMDPGEHLRAELGVRKDILRVVLDCASQDAQALKTKIEGVGPDESRTAALRTRFINQLDGALAYYEDARGKIDTLGISGSKDLASTIREWRTNTYGPGAEQAVDFLVWTRNQDLFKTAHTRFAGILKTVDVLKLRENENTASLIESAERNLADASAENDAARAALEQFPPRDDAFLRIKRSLETLAKTYESFFDLSDLTQTVHPKEP